MQTNAQKLTSVLVELDVKIDPERVDRELETSYKQLGRTARLRGYRPGKAPRHVLVQVFGSRIASEVAQRLVQATFKEALQSQPFQVVGDPHFEHAAASSGQAFSYKARIEVLPQLEAVRYEGLGVTRPTVSVDEAQIDEEIERLRRVNSTLEPLTEPRGATEGDVVTVDFRVQVGGQPVEDAGATDYDIDLGHSSVLREISEVVTGSRTGDALEAVATLPAEHPHPELRGKQATFKITVKDVKRRVLPLADDEFAKDLGDYETMADLRKEITERLRKQAEAAAKDALAQALVDALVQANPIEVPSALVDQQAQVTEREVLAQARRAGRPGRITGPLREAVRQDSEKKVRAGLLMADVAKKEGLVIGDAEIEEGLGELATQTGKNIARLRAEYAEKSKRDQLIGMILESKVLDILEAKANIAEPAAAGA